MDLTNFEQFKETENYMVYLQKDRAGQIKFEMVVYYKKEKRYWRVILTRALFELFFTPAEYLKVYTHRQK